MNEMLAGTPILYVCPKTGNSYPGCVMGIANDGDQLLMYRHEDGNYYTDTLKASSFEVNARAMTSIDLFAKVVTIEESIRLYSNTQRKEEVHGSVLRVIRYEEQDRGRISFVLQTDRRDGVSLRFDPVDIEFIYPTVYSDIHVDTIFKKGNIVSAIKNNKSCGIKKGQEYNVTKVLRDERTPDMDILYLKSDESSFVAYARYFKLSKTK
jgi:hypothetical protein